jgi:predicted RecB family nuclease
MGKSRNPARLLPPPKGEVVVTSELFEAYLACPTKCFLRFTGEVATGNTIATWNHTRSESYRHDGTRRLTADNPQIFGSCSTERGRWKNAPWRFAHAHRVSAHNLEASLHAIQRIPPEGARKAPQLVPVRFTPPNKLSRSDKLIAGFDALVLSKAFGVKVGSAKIIHGGHGKAFKLKTNSLSREVNKTVAEIAALLSAPSPPVLILNRHCPECDFQDRCQTKLAEKDDLSLLSNMPHKEITRLNNKGIFTVSQLSYTFRPRRRIRQRAARPEKYHHALKALAIREQKIHVVGHPQFRIDGTPVVFDVEGIPDRDFYYLIGVRIEGDHGVSHHSFWADNRSDEERIWGDFLQLLSEVSQPVLIHYGGFEATFLKKMYDRYGGPPEASAAAKAIASPVNVLSVIYAQVYFPVYSNGLKDIARFLGFEWSNPSSSGLQSIVWRHQWETLGDPTVREMLTAYNTDDCEALNLVLRILVRISQPDSDAAATTGSEPGIVHEESLGRNLPSKWRAFKSPLSDLEHINRAARWDYQRDRVYIRSRVPRKKATTERTRSGKIREEPERVVVLKVPTSCPVCGAEQRREARLLFRTVRDLAFGRNSVQGRVVKYTAQTYRCSSCKQEYGLHEPYLNGSKWGWNTLAYFVYHIVGLRVPQLTMQRSLKRLYGFDVARSTLSNFKVTASKYYSVTKRRILERIVHGNLIHADETRANIKGHLAYVWVLTNLREVVYILAESREGQIVQDLLRDFDGVLVSDFYAAYSAVACPQQKCLIHLMRDLNDEILHNPFDEQMKSIALGFAGLLKPIVETIDRRGLKKYYLRKHLIRVDRFYRYLDESDFKSDAASKIRQRFIKNRDTLFTFLRHDGVPWNNNNAEHAVKAFAGLRDVLSGLMTKSSLDEYLTLLSVAETCEYQGLDFLDFLRSEETDVDTFARGRRRHRGLRKSSLR